MPEHSCHLAVCIPTYRRAHLLRLLLGDLKRQSVSIARLIIVDGDPGSGDVPAALEAVTCWARELLYMPSNHANLPYQRYLGWKAAKGAACLLYLDDDLRLLSTQSIEALIRPLRARRGRVAGVTTEFAAVSGATAHRATGKYVAGHCTTTDPAEADGRHRVPGRDSESSRLAWRALSRLGSSQQVPAGGLSPAGHRCPPADRRKPYELVGCLRGGAMAYRMSAVTSDCFSEALFAMGQRGWALGEDTLLSRRIGSRGVLLTAFRAGIVHPGDHHPVAYRRDAFGRGYATAYSRRLLNDHFRGFDPPRWPDRAALLKSYAANVAISWASAVSAADANLYAFACGYTLGAMRGLLQSPTSRRLTPEVDWWADAEAAFAQTRSLTLTTA